MVNTLRLPSWLSAKNLYIAEQLLAQGFHYCGHSDDFCEGHFVEGLEDWDFFFAYGELGLDAICNKALFSLDLGVFNLGGEDALEHSKKLISYFSHEWDHNSQHHRQLCLFAA